MSNPEFRDYMTVELRRHLAGDDIVTEAAKVSTLAGDSVGADESAGLINFLLKGRHGSPFEHAIFTWYVEAPIFVWREIMRHRIASYNEESGRYKQLKPVFYLPGDDRNILQIGKPGEYSYIPGEDWQIGLVRKNHMMTATFAYKRYEELLAEGIAREVARMTLPLNIFSSAYVTMNARALMNFLSLRTKDPKSMFPSFPQREIEMCAEKMEEDFARLMPLTFAAWHNNGRVAP